MRCYDWCSRIICRVLYGRKAVDILSDRKNNDTSRMLSCTASNSDTPLRKSLYLGISLVDVFQLKVLFHITKGCLFRNGCYGSRPEGLTISKDNLRVFMSFCLILSGKIKVNIRLFIPFEPKKCLKGNIKALLFHHGSAPGANLIRHVTSGITCIFLHILAIKVTVLTLRAKIMRRKRIYFSNTGGICNKR